MATINTDYTEIKITLGATMWDRGPTCSVYLDDQCLLNHTFKSPEPITANFAGNLDHGDHTIKVQLLNKEDSDTIVDANSEIIKDMLLHIVDITIDEISLKNAARSESKYIIDNPVEYQGKTVRELDKCIDLGWNGTYYLPFTVPFYLWLLETV